ncbi:MULTISPECIES: YciI family protein [Streptomyces]|uniref:YciI family protein n=1 Tax=Streptomyces TaxID=1883 RepID=UPI001164A5A0|nr:MULTISPECIES: YciI family protein [unclassified Streptomyces]NMI56330.1 transcription initiation protein [Streptomyces sp. RLA2-12]QDN55755.1 transcription initiation protein [Streptomyces sp. S1D4-20]QDN65933.1 transcription initiation protein [Streptomyces sp. S1D4-14]QDO48341.1 transcription initiation protein [Streptomyces sp. RLB3-5]QDO58581.1 transcription initiation protein [Streptomyces sp. RLB1-8]
MKYVLFICTPVGGEELSPAQIADDPRFTSYIEEVRSRDIVKGGARLRPSTDATTVRVQGDEVLLSDGPFVESKEYVAGFDLIEVADLDEAIALASRHPAALGGGSVEVRPVWE